MTVVNGWSLYWTIWFFAAAVAFMVPEFLALATGRPQDTLSHNVWRLEGFVPGQAVWQWTAVHVLFSGVLIVFLAWLIGHLCFHLWT